MPGFCRDESVSLLQARLQIEQEPHHDVLRVDDLFDRAQDVYSSLAELVLQVRLEEVRE